MGRPPKNSRSERTAAPTKQKKQAQVSPQTLHLERSAFHVVGVMSNGIARNPFGVSQGVVVLCPAATVCSSRVSSSLLVLVGSAAAAAVVVEQLMVPGARREETTARLTLGRVLVFGAREEGCSELCGAGGRR